MRILLDTHALVWWLLDEPYLSDRARSIIADPDNTIYMSAASGWEISTKYRLGKLQQAKDLVDYLPQLIQKARIEQLNVTLEHAMLAGQLPGPHRDPFDRMLIAQSRIEHLPILTKDPVFQQYNIRVMW